MSNDAKAHTPTPLTARVHKNGRDFEIVANALRPEWVGTELGQNQVIATLSIGDFTDATGAARALNEANAAFIVRACNAHEQLVAALADLYRATDGVASLAPDTLDGPRERAEAALASVRS